MSKDELPPAAASDRQGPSAARRRLTIGLSALAALLILGVPCPLLGLSLWESKWEGRLQAQLAALDADGLGIAPDTLYPAPQPRNPADALAPVLGRFSALSDPEADALLEEENRIYLPDVYADFRHYTPPSQLATHDRTVAALMARIAASEAEIDQALALEGPWVFPVEWSDGYAAEMPHLMGVKQLINLLKLRGLSRLQDGDPAGWQDVVRCVDLADCIDEPAMISRLVRDALCSLAVKAIESALRHARPSPAQREHLLATLARLERPQGLQRALRGEVALLLTTIPASEEGWERLTKSSERARRTPFLWRGYLLRDQTMFVSLVSDAIRGAAAGPRQAADSAQQVDERYRGLQPFAYPLTSIMMPGVVRFVDKDLENLACLRLARLALEMSSDERLPARMPQLLDDPFGGTLRWRRDGPRTGVLWSLGADRTDDGGTPLYSDDPDAPPRDTWDVVFRLELPAEGD